MYLTIGNKDGLDLNVEFKNIDEMRNDDFWIKNYSNKLAIYRYTVEKKDSNFILKEIEQIGY